MTTTSVRNRHRRLVAAALVLATMAVTAPSGAHSDHDHSAGDLRSEREAVRQQKAEIAAEIDEIEASDAELRDALEQLDDHLRQEEAALERAEAEVQQALDQAAEIREQEAETQARIDDMARRMTTMAVESYAEPSRSSDLVALTSGDINEAVRKRALMGIVNTHSRDLAEQFRAEREVLLTLEAERLDALARAEEARAEVEERVEQVAEAREDQQRLLEAVESRADRLLSEAAALEELDADLSEQIREKAREAAAAAARARRQERAANASQQVRLAPVGELVSVRGIWVHQSIADNLEGLMAAAEADGIILAGGGYRDPSEQIALRKAHCGTSDYAVYQMPASQCTPPTARPGSSNHERGLAVDFTHNGSILTRSSPAFAWLQQNAGQFGFRNLPSEPWHWSPDGR